MSVNTLFLLSPIYGLICYFFAAFTGYPGSVSREAVCRAGDLFDRRESWKVNSRCSDRHPLIAYINRSRLFFPSHHKRCSSVRELPD